MTTSTWLANYIADRLRQMGVGDDIARSESVQMQVDIDAAFRAISRLESACGSGDD